MKYLKYFWPLFLFCGAAANAQTTNCGYAVPFFAQDHIVREPIAPAKAISSETQTYRVSCTNSSNKNIYKTQNAVVTATGHTVTQTGSGGGLLYCNPVFSTRSTSSGSMNVPASFTLYGQSYSAVIGVVGTSSKCVLGPADEDITYCQPAACVSTACAGQGSPVIVDPTGDGFALTSSQDGVKFDIAGNGQKVQIAWTAPGASTAFLALPGSDGLIHTGQQLFGNFTPQPLGNYPKNGFAALAVFDDPKNGGNGDGIIDRRDAVFASLRLWVDTNHDGISQPREIHSLPSLGVNSISLNYHQSDRTDAYGNSFRFRTRLNPDRDTDAGKTAWDVFFVIDSGTAKSLLKPTYQMVNFNIRPRISMDICPPSGL